MAKYVIDQMVAAKQRKQPFYIHHNMVLPHVPIVPTPSDLKLGKEKSLDRMIQYMDQIVGDLIDAVDSLGLSEHTYIIFAGDNGTQSELSRSTTKGEVSGGKWQMNDAGFHVPLVIKSPYRKKAKAIESNALVDFADFFPTLCELLNIPIPEYLDVDGQSFVEAIEGGEIDRKWVTGGINGNFMVFDGNWRLHYRDSILVDCRELPTERIVPLPFNEQEQEAYDRLLKQVMILANDFKRVKF